MLIKPFYAEILTDWDASDDLMMCEDDTLLIPYQIGDVFISHSQEETQEMLAAKVTNQTQCVSHRASEPF